MFNTKGLKKSINKKRIKKILKSKYIKLVGAILVTISLLVGGYNFFYWGKIYPEIYIAGVNVGGLTKEEAVNTLKNRVNTPEKLILTSSDQTFNLDLASIDFSYDFGESVDKAFLLYRTGNFFYDIPSSLISYFKRPTLGLFVNINDNNLSTSLATIATQVGVKPIYPSAQLVKGEVVVNKGQSGTEMDNENIKVKVTKDLSLADFSPIEISLMKKDPSLSEDEAHKYQKRLENLVGKKMVLTFEYQTFTFTEDAIFKVVNPTGEYNDNVITNLISNISSQVNRDPQNPVFVFADNRVQEFKASKDGIKVDEEDLHNKIIDKLHSLEENEDKTASVSVPVKSTPSAIQTSEVNNLGIKELLGRGSSRFYHSISSRIHNIGLASSKFNGVLVAPGDSFSFNQILGDVSAYTGYQQAYVIKDGATVLGDGGGVCQVSTTLFRAILDAGLPVVERHAHSYRVGYYEQDSPPGLDATVYSPSPDLKFKNDTPGYLLIQTIFDPKNVSLVFEIYGTNDGRTASTTKPVVTSVTPPPEDKYIDDPTLPAGTVKQIDYKAWGAKVQFTYTVKRSGQTLINKTYYSNYQPWQAVFLRGTGPGS